MHLIDLLFPYKKTETGPRAFSMAGPGFLNALPLPIRNTKQFKHSRNYCISPIWGGGPRIVVCTAAFHATVRGSVPGLGGLKETKNVSSPSTCESQYCGEPP